MKWFDNWFRRQSEKAWASAQNNTVRKKYSLSTLLTTDSPVADESLLDSRIAYTIKMQTATGGTVIEVSRYNSIQGEWVKDLFIIPEDKDLTTELSSILVQYKLKHN